MPIRESQKHRYPSDWKKTSLNIRKRSLGRCECEGECGLHENRRCEEANGRTAKHARGKIVLTVAHLDHNPENCDEDNLKALCQRCHLRYDMHNHKLNATITRRRKLNILELQFSNETSD